MTTYFAANEADAINLSAGAYEYAGNVISGFTRGAIDIPGGGTDYAEAKFIVPSTGALASLTAFWAHAKAANSSAPGSSAAGYNVFAFLNSAKAVVAQLASTATLATFNLQVLVSGTMTTVGSVTGLPANLAGDLDVQVKVAASGWIRIFYAGNKVYEYLGDTSGMGSVSYVRWGANGNRDIYYSMLIVADYTTIGHTVRTRTPTGEGTYTAWAGAYTSVAEFPRNDATVNTDGTAGDKRTYTAAALAATASGNVIKSVSIGARLKLDDAGGPQNAKPMLRISSTDYVGGFNYQGVSQSWSPCWWSWETDPSTGAAWASVTNVNVEFGLQSAA